MRSRPFYLGLIPARGGSKRIPRKNLVKLGGKPLIAYSIESGLRSKKIARVVVSTDDEEIAAAAKAWGADAPFLRPRRLAGDLSPALDAVLHAVAQIEKDGRRVDAVVLLQPTSPFRPRGLVDACIARFEQTRADTLTTVYDTAQHPFHAWRLRDDGFIVPFHPMRYQSISRSRLPRSFAETGDVYIIGRAALRRKKLYGRRVVPFLVDPRTSVDIDTFEDLEKARRLLRGTR